MAVFYANLYTIYIYALYSQVPETVNGAGNQDPTEQSVQVLIIPSCGLPFGCQDSTPIGDTFFPKEEESYWGPRSPKVFAKRMRFVWMFFLGGMFLGLEGRHFCHLSCAG